VKTWVVPSFTNEECRRNEPSGERTQGVAGARSFSLLLEPSKGSKKGTQVEMAAWLSKKWGGRSATEADKPPRNKRSKILDVRRHINKDSVHERGERWAAILRNREMGIYTIE